MQGAEELDRQIKDHLLDMCFHHLDVWPDFVHHFQKILMKFDIFLLFFMFNHKPGKFSL